MFFSQSNVRSSWYVNLMISPECVQHLKIDRLLLIQEVDTIILSSSHSSAFLKRNSLSERIYRKSFVHNCYFIACARQNLRVLPKFMLLFLIASCSWILVETELASPACLLCFCTRDLLTCLVPVGSR